MSGRGPVLVVDDDFDVREALCEVLTECGFDVTAASDGQEALTLLQGGLSPSVILLDLMMPRMDGAELRTRLLEEPAFARLPVILLTADRRSEARPLVTADAFLRKPVDLDELLLILDRFS